jgi:hypothetical protein
MARLFVGGPPGAVTPPSEDARGASPDRAEGSGKPGPILFDHLTLLLHRQYTDLSVASRHGTTRPGGVCAPFPRQVPLYATRKGPGCEAWPFLFDRLRPLPELEVSCLHISALPHTLITESMDYGSGVFRMNGWNSCHQLKINWEN